MPHTKRDEYITYRDRFVPKPVKLVIVAESPPASGKYFYNPEGTVTEPLFKAMMGQLGITPISKEEGLREFQRRGWVLVDATYQPVNALGPEERDAVIAQDYHLLRDDLAALVPDKSVPIILVKMNVFRLLHRQLAVDGFNVINGDVAVYFPSHGRQRDFERQFAAVLKSASLK